jgi:hypothetical protein
VLHHLPLSRTGDIANDQMDGPHPRRWELLFVFCGAVSVDVERSGSRLYHLLRSD